MRLPVRCRAGRERLGSTHMGGAEKVMTFPAVHLTRESVTCTLRSNIIYPNSCNALSGAE